MKSASHRIASLPAGMRNKKLRKCSPIVQFVARQQVVAGWFQYRIITTSGRRVGHLFNTFQQQQPQQQITTVSE